MTEETLTDAEKEEFDQYAKLLGYGSNLPDPKQNVHTFLFNVATADDTTKLGNLKEEEIGMMPNPIRAYKNLGLFAKDIMGKDELYSFFNANSEIVTSTSLSREGFLVDHAVIQKRELKDATKPRKPNSSWFKPKNKSTEGSEESE